MNFNFDNINQEQYFLGSLYTAAIGLCGVISVYCAKKLGMLAVWCRNALNRQAKEDAKKYLGIEDLEQNLKGLQKGLEDLKEEVHSVVSNKTAQNGAVFHLEEKFAQGFKLLMNEIKEIKQEKELISKSEYDGLSRFLSKLNEKIKDDGRK